MLLDTSGNPIRAEQYSAPALGDLDGDGRLDLLVGQKTAEGLGQVLFYRNVGTPQAMAFASGVPLAAGGQTLNVPAEGCLGVFPRAADLDHDGRVDLVLGLATGGVQFCRNLGTDAASHQPIFAAPMDLLAGPAANKQPINVGKRATPDVADFNGDGRMDLVVGALDGKVRVFLNLASAGMPDFQAAANALAGRRPARCALRAEQSVLGRSEWRRATGPALRQYRGPTLLLCECRDGCRAATGPGRSPVRQRHDRRPARPAPLAPLRCRPQRRRSGRRIGCAQDGFVHFYAGQAVAALDLRDAAGNPVSIDLNENTLLIGAATWCKACAAFKQWIATPEMQSQLQSLRLVFAFGNEGGQGPNGVLHPEFLTGLPGEVVFLGPACQTPPNRLSHGLRPCPRQVHRH